MVERCRFLAVQAFVSAIPTLLGNCFRPFRLWLINGGYQALTLAAIGGVLGLFAR